MTLNLHDIREKRLAQFLHAHNNVDACPASSLKAPPCGALFRPVDLTFKKYVSPYSNANTHAGEEEVCPYIYPYR
jgi:hypothetical protein